MIKLKVLALVVGMALLLALPATVLAQAAPDHTSLVTATIDGDPAPDGTKITAMVEGKDDVTATTMDGKAVIKIPGSDADAGKEITFMIGEMMAAETDTWEKGGHADIKFSISAMMGMMEPTEEPPTMEPGDGNGMMDDKEMMMGPKGPQGPPGIAGRRGAAGATGSQGPQGPQGSAGSQGSQGPQGPAGNDGAAGQAGSAGGAGPAGATGPAGPAGSSGSSALGVVALILAIVALVGAGGAFLMRRGA